MTIGKTQRERDSGVKARHRENKIAEADYHRERVNLGPDRASRPTHYNGRKQHRRLVTVKGGKQAMRPRSWSHGA